MSLGSGDCGVRSRLQSRCRWRSAGRLARLQRDRMGGRFAMPTISVADVHREASDSSITRMLHVRR